MIPETIEHIPYDYPDQVVKFENLASYETVFKAIKKYLPQGSSVLDIGSGRAEMMKMLAEAGCEVCGCDMDDECIRMSSRYGNVVKIDVNNISSASCDRKFDCVLVSHVLEHLDNPRESLLRMAALSNGLIVASVPNPYYLLFVVKTMLGAKPAYMNMGHLQVWTGRISKLSLKLAAT